MKTESGVGYKISVIVPVYNVELYLCKCLDSILAQTHTNLEIILIDDGSPDNCGAICDEYAQKDNRVKVIHKANGGLSDARNAGLDISTGDYIGFVDSDDYIEPDMYELLLEALIRTGSDIAVCGHTRVSEDGSPICTKYTLDREKVYTQADAIGGLLTCRDFISYVWDKLYRRSLFEEIRFPKGKIYEDMLLTCRLFFKSNKIVHIGKEKYYYLIRNNSICHQPFSERTFDLFYQAESVWRFINVNVRNLNTEADYFLWRNLALLLHHIYFSDDVDGSCKEEMDIILRKWALKLNTSKLLTVRERLSFLKRLILYSIKNAR